MTDDKIIFVTDVLFDQLKMNDVVEGVGDLRGKIMETFTANSDRINKELKLVVIIWDGEPDQKYNYPYALLNEVKYFGNVMDDGLLSADHDHRQNHELVNDPNVVGGYNEFDKIEDEKNVTYVTDISFSDLKKGHRLKGVNGDLGTIVKTDIVRDERIGDESNHNVVGIIWSECVAEVKLYRYEILSKVQVIGEPNDDFENMILSSAEYDEETKTVSDTTFKPQDQFSVIGELLDVALTENNPYIAIMSHDVVIVAPIEGDVSEINHDIFDFIDEKIRVNLIVDDDYTLSIKSFELDPQD